ncbi:MAG: phosphatase PAP2 family protein [Bacteroidia bacterium]|nr:phosphatase PAP2 family protein [Bacteroidia bacterium]
MLDLIKSIDLEILLAINHSGNEFIDKVMVLISNRFTWIPFYLLLAILLFKTCRQHFVYVLIAAAVLILLSDQTSVLLKNAVGRYRPCHHVPIASMLKLPDGCGGLYGFPSSHAANTAALAFFLIPLFKNNRKLMSALMISYCLLVGYSRIYLGRHYVTDIISGWVVGAACGLLVFFAFQKIIHHVSQNSKLE